MSKPEKPVRRVELEFQDWEALPGVEDPLRHDISTIAAIGDSIFVACDETASVEQLAMTESGSYAKHRHFRLGDVFDLPDGDDGEMDIEGLDIDDGYLWITGSHSLKRDRPKRNSHGAQQSLERMMEIDRDPNRYFIGCLPIREADDGTMELVEAEGSRVAASLKLHKKKSILLKWLRKDEHIGSFLDIPSKENGFDIEGIAAKGKRVWLGLRGPVLRGYAVIIELDLKRPRPHRLKARKIEKGRRYRKHVIDSAGLGIRDLCFDGRDLLILTGTPLASDGPSHILRWRDAAHDTLSGVVDPERIEHVMEIPYKGAIDHPEGIAIAPRRGKKSRDLFVVYDSPAPDRIAEKPARLIADVFKLPNRG